ncbi:MAG TPA: hypothetical protein VGZ27_14220 [Vicinamibacterales bacterium]|nr:hypothetical protein [Vicinamibacterales bacterium]
MKQLAVVLALLSLAPRPTAAGRQAAPAPNDLDRFMEQVLARRDDNWKKLQQYILDERERAELRGPGRTLVWGQERDYTWYVRDGYFVRSPVRFNGVTISEGDRQKYEDNFLKQAKERDKRNRNKAADPSAADAPPAATPDAPPPAPPDVQGLISQTREPQFISSAYFLQFKFEPGRYALVGREKIDNRDVLKIEYYPTRLFQDDPKTRTERRVREAASKPPDESYGAEMQRLMNKVSLITLWVEPSQHQIVKYTFDNAGLDFLPAAWLVRIADLRASMLMSEAFAGIWLPKRIDSTGAIVLAPGRFDITYSLDYSGYREATVSTRIHTGAVR